LKRLEAIENSLEELKEESSKGNSSKDKKMDEEKVNLLEKKSNKRKMSQDQENCFLESNRKEGDQSMKFPSLLDQKKVPDSDSKKESLLSSFTPEFLYAEISKFVFSDDYTKSVP
jgi:hypothetical protein